MSWKKIVWILGILCPVLLTSCHDPAPDLTVHPTSVVQARNYVVNYLEDILVDSPVTLHFSLLNPKSKNAFTVGTVPAADEHGKDRYRGTLWILGSGNGPNYVEKLLDSFDKQPGWQVDYPTRKLTTQTGYSFAFSGDSLGNVIVDFTSPTMPAHLSQDGAPFPPKIDRNYQRPPLEPQPPTHSHKHDHKDANKKSSDEKSTDTKATGGDASNSASPTPTKPAG